MRTVLTIMILAFGVAAAAFAKTHYATKTEMIADAECIAVVRLTRGEETDDLDRPLIEGQRWIYASKATGRVQRCLKGAVRGKIDIYGFELVKGRQCRYSKGRFLLFLKKDVAPDGEKFWVGSNGRMGIRPIKDDKVEWFEGDDDRSETKMIPLADVISEIEDQPSQSETIPALPESEPGSETSEEAGDPVIRLHRRIAELTQRIATLAKKNERLEAKEAILREQVRLLNSKIAALETEVQKEGETERRDSDRPKTRLFEKEVILLANDEALRHGIELNKYHPPKVKCRREGKGVVWRVWYSGVERVKGNYFDVEVNDRTGECRLTPGE